VVGGTPQDVGALLKRLKGLRLVYPDGSINNYAKQYLHAMIMKSLNQGRRRAPAVSAKQAGE